MSQNLPGDSPDPMPAYYRPAEPAPPSAEPVAARPAGDGPVAAGQDHETHQAKAANALLRADALVAGYVPGVNILNGCDLYANKGELVGIIGPNGAGKSTLLKAIFGLIPIREGKVTIRQEPTEDGLEESFATRLARQLRRGGKPAAEDDAAGEPGPNEPVEVDITNASANKLVARGVGYVPQTNNVFPSLTIEENLQVGTYLRPKRFNQRFEFVASLFPALKDRRKQRAGSLSGGERQMVAMARALMMEPSVLLLDEPSAGLSPALQDEVFFQTKRINATGVTVIMVEQNARRCLQICDRGYVLDQGRNAYTGRGTDLMHDPKVIELYLGTLARAR